MSRMSKPAEQPSGVKSSPTVARQVGRGFVLSMRLIAGLLTLLFGGVAVWAYTMLRGLKDMAAKPTDGLGEMIVGTVGVFGGLFYTNVLIVGIVACLGCAGWTYAMHLRLRTMR